MFNIFNIGMNCLMLHPAENGCGNGILATPFGNLHGVCVQPQGDGFCPNSDFLFNVWSPPLGNLHGVSVQSLGFIWGFILIFAPCKVCQGFEEVVDVLAFIQIFN